MNAPLQPAMLKLIDAMTALLVDEYLHGQPAPHQEQMPDRTERAPFPVVERAA